ncbi:DUF551 domain-containing protein [Klebsiella quasipneumoniae subsp. similipneumoniae]|nr:DUF551 domain-containing protein [Klebsiella quasipneumoniae]MBC4168718.1 DUF551 domain-containing protein [Klebsiella quasipneumoniae]MBX8479364.1 DUF551 domain-containing protein [Klebsiella quasipneumoniae subsp. similipneumoniae]MBX9411496.1 DUF551 domain-containing protein [Klebsiella quasipneumoniae subsp. similipneumoniae]MBX9417719.1 DUF551 domain-containing protein [Klebsiella quasipneumoniae subsp. similipneumoniae]HBT4704266.1 DUF551 domain-containing protein [Klebsiella quasipne
MTIKLSRERLEELAAGRSGFNLRVATYEESQELARIALAAMDSEPVAEVLSNRPGNDTSTIDVALPVGAQLYFHAQPAPVVPDGYVMVPIEPTEAMMLHNSGCQHHAWDDPDCAMRQTRRLIWSHMLAAAPQSPGSEPATVPGKWIPVSERMPEVGVKVLCFPVEDEPIHAVFNGQLWLQDISWSNSDEPIDNVITCNVTHWMPLPAAPQESKP